MSEQGGVRKPQRFSFRGEYEWMAPEMLAQDFGYATPADIYSLGITLYEIANGVTPYPDWPPLHVRAAHSWRHTSLASSVVLTCSASAFTLRRSF